MKMDIRVGTIKAAEKVAKTKKLLKLTVDTGIDTRTIVSGIAEHFEPEQLVGKQACFLVNLAPREIKGITSNGMILMAQDADGKLRLVQPNEAVKPGSQVG
jgi:methionyl-tRNA synthetase